MSFRVGGLVSGLDTHTLIQQLMELERKPIETLQARGQKLQIRQSAWQGIDSRIKTLETALTKLADLFKDSALQVESSSDSLTAAITGEVDMEKWQVEIERLAQSRTIASDSFTTVGPGEFSLNGFTVQLEEATDARSLAAAINTVGDSKFVYESVTDGEISVSGIYRGEADSQLVVEAQGTDLMVYKDGELVQTFSAALDGAGNANVVYDGLNISFSQVQSGDSVEIQANTSRETGVSASVVDGRVVLNSDNHEAIEFSDPQGILEQIGVLDLGGNEKNVLVEGSTALVRINGLLVERDSNIIDDVLPGIVLTLNQAGEEKIGLNVSRNKAAITESLGEIVSQVNALVKSLDSKGSLGHDTMAYRLEESLRRTLSSVTGLGENLNSLSSIGLSTDRYGVLELSTDKLDAAMGEDFAAIEDLLLGEKGLTESLKSASALWVGSNGFIKTRLDTYTTQIKNNDSSLVRAEERVKIKEEQLWRQFTAMERALSSLQNQGNWLAGQLGSLPGYNME